MQTVGTGGGYAGTKNVLIEGGIWDGLGSVTKNTNPIFRFVHASDIEFLNCTLQNSFNAHHLEMGGIKGLSILGCTFSDYSQAVSYTHLGKSPFICSRRFWRGQRPVYGADP